jgi:hypothetical protein
MGMFIFIQSYLFRASDDGHMPMPRHQRLVTKGVIYPRETGILPTNLSTVVVSFPFNQLEYLREIVETGVEL